MTPDRLVADGNIPTTRAYQQELLEESIKHNIIIAMDTGSGKTHIAVLRMKHELNREPSKVVWFFAPTVALCEQQKAVIETFVPGSVGLVSGALEPDQWKSSSLWERVLQTHRVVVSTPQVFLDALRHGYINLARDISLLVFDEAHHAADNHPYNRIMLDFYHTIDPIPRNQIIYGTSQERRPFVMGLTASPIYGKNAALALHKLETNLDCITRTTMHNRDELEKFVPRPRFQHVMYHTPNPPPFSTNLTVISDIIRSLRIEDDPSVIRARKILSETQPDSPEYRRADQKLSLLLRNQKTFTMKGLKDFERAADEILHDIGPWAADWYIWKVVENAKIAANPYNNIMGSWQSSEKAHILGILEKMTLSPTAYEEDDILQDCSHKVQQLIQTLLQEKMETEELEEIYSGLIFVQRRDSVIALAELLNHHPFTKGIFRIGILIGTSDNSSRHGFLDITRKLSRDSHAETMRDFKSGELNLIVATAVAEEGIDIQACGSVIRWDLPPNMASWAQSRGRARRKRSTFTLMFAHGSADQSSVTKWEALEQQMIAAYTDPSRDQIIHGSEDDQTIADEPDNDDVAFTVKSTGARVDLNSAISHLSHFCAVIPSTAHVDNRPMYDIDPPEMPFGWHENPVQSTYAADNVQYNGPWGSKVSLPRCLPLACREFTVDREYSTKASAHRHVAFKAYLGLYNAGLLTDNLLPFTSVMEPDRENDVKEMLKDVEKRAGMASVDMQMDPWAAPMPSTEKMDDDSHKYWYTARLIIGDLPPLVLFTRSEPTALSFKDGPILFRPDQDGPTNVSLSPLGRVHEDGETVSQAKEYTRRVFWSLNSTRMQWDNLDFAYLVHPEFADQSDVWRERRVWLNKFKKNEEVKNHDREYVLRARVLGEHFGYIRDPVLVLKEFGRPYQFVRWRNENEQLSEEEEEELRSSRKRRDTDDLLEIKYPLLVVKPFHPRRNFLVPCPPPNPKAVPPETKYINLLPEFNGIVFISAVEVQYALLLPSVLRALGMMFTMTSLRSTLFQNAPVLRSIPIKLLTNSMTASSAGENFNYQRLETLGDTVLKFLVGLNVMVEYPFWHEGYLTKKKDHTVSNVKLAKENLKRDVFRWIMRDSMLGRKWKPKYTKLLTVETPLPSPVNEKADSGIMIVDMMEQTKGEVREAGDDMIVGTTTSRMQVGVPAPENVKAKEVDGEKTEVKQVGVRKRKKKGKSPKQDLSTKVLADVVESLIGAAYLHGSFDLAYECVKLFDLGMIWRPLKERHDTFLSRVSPDVRIPAALEYVELMLGYNFKHKILLLEALTHASYQQDVQTVSYERMEFLGDSVLDMVVTHLLYHAPGKNYSPGHIHLRRSAVVNTHFLAFICLNTSLKFDAELPRPSNGRIQLRPDAQEITLWQCLLHSNSRVMDDQVNTYSRFRKRKEEIENALNGEVMFPWASLTRLQAPKFFSDIIESVIGAVYLDSGGDMNAARLVIRRLGILPVLERIIQDDVDVWHPGSRIAQWASKHGKTLDYKFGREKGVIWCKVFIDGEEVAEAEDEYRGHSTQDEVKLAASEEASKVLKIKSHMNNVMMVKGKTKREKLLRDYEEIKSTL